jgi:hypothetical protein
MGAAWWRFGLVSVVQEDETEGVRERKVEEERRGDESGKECYWNAYLVLCRSLRDVLLSSARW